MLSQALAATNNFFLWPLLTQSQRIRPQRRSFKFFYATSLTDLLLCLRLCSPLPSYSDLQISKWRCWYPTFSMLPISPHSPFAVSALFLYSSSPSHRAPSSRFFTFLSETKKTHSLVLSALLLCSWSSLQNYVPQKHFIGRPSPPCSLAISYPSL